MGGDTGSAVVNVVEYASIPSGGAATYAWTKSANSLVYAEWLHSCVTANNYIYCMGGDVNGNGATTVQYASIPGGGGPPSTWAATNTLVYGEYGLACVTANNYIYCMGGNAGSMTTVQYASVAGGGAPGAWTATNTLKVGEEQLSCTTSGNYIYCMGGSGTESTVQYASIPSGGGAPGTWTSQSANTLSYPEYYHSCVTLNNYIYCMGGIVTSPYNQVQYATISGSGGYTGPWYQQSNTLAVGEYAHSCVTANNYIYCLGGGSSNTVVQYAMS
jgi:hypothetical protein